MGKANRDNTIRIRMCILHTATILLYYHAATKKCGFFLREESNFTRVEKKKERRALLR